MIETDRRDALKRWALALRAPSYIIRLAEPQGESWWTNQGQTGHWVLEVAITAKPRKLRAP